jgi:hypothetical protein
VIWIRSALALDEAVRTFVGPMRKVAADIPVSP